MLTLSSAINYTKKARNTKLILGAFFSMRGIDEIVNVTYLTDRGTVWVMQVFIIDGQLMGED